MFKLHLKYSFTLKYWNRPTESFINCHVQKCTDALKITGEYLQYLQVSAIKF